jgi:hypothetical protein
VGCDLVDIGDWYRDEDDDRWYFRTHDNGLCRGMPPEDTFEEEFGLPYAGQSRLAVLNDGSETQQETIIVHDFDEIADVLEAWFGPDLNKVPDDDIIRQTT